MYFKKKFKILIFLIFFVFAVSLSIYILQVLQNIQNKQDLDYQNFYQNFKDTGDLQKIIDNTSAEGVIVYDPAQNKILGGKNIYKTYSLASLTKVITAVLVYEKDKSLLDDIRNMLKRSSNEEADRLAFTFSSERETQVEYMNDFTKKYGLYFRNVSGLDTEDLLAGGEGRPIEFINFIREYYFKYPEIFDGTIEDKDNTNIIINNLNFLSASKTGFTYLSGGNLFVIVQKGLGREIFILVLNSTEKNRFVDVQNIANFLLQSSI